jgi:hypothetical protein
MRGHRRDANLKHLDHLVAAGKQGWRTVGCRGGYIHGDVKLPGTVMLLVVAKLSRPTRTPADGRKRQQCRTRSWTTSTMAAHKGPRAHSETNIDGKERPRRWLVVYRPHVRLDRSLGVPWNFVLGGGGNKLKSSFNSHLCAT